MEQLVRVKETYDDGTALVFRIRESACSGDCHKCSGCGAAKETVTFTAKNPIGARRGELVKVESETAPVLKAAAVLYVVPLVLFFLGYYIGFRLGASARWSGGLGLCWASFWCWYTTAKWQGKPILTIRSQLSQGKYEKSHEKRG